MLRRPALLVAGGLDPLGGAGITADSTLAATLGVAPLPVLLAIVEQDSTGVHRLLPEPPSRVEGSLRAALGDGSPTVAKLGVIGSPDTAELVGRLLRVWLAGDERRRVVLDPVLRGGTLDGAPLASEAMPTLLRGLLGPRWVVTPNAAELAALCGEAGAPTSHASTVARAERLHRETGCAVLVKSGHTERPGCDGWVDEDGTTLFAAQPVWSESIHGTGCFVATALAVGLCHGLTAGEAAERATRLLAQLVASGGVEQVGQGRPQLRHAEARW